jgi:ferredoxin
MRVLKRIAVLLLPLLAAALGAVAGPTLARVNDTVSLADEVLAQESAKKASDKASAAARESKTSELAAKARDRMAAFDRATTDEVFAFVQSSRGREDLLDEARGIERTFRWGTGLLGLWCGLVAAIRIASVSRVPRRTDYEIEHRLCVACGRCFRHCPRERLRLKKVAEAAEV